MRRHVGTVRADPVVPPRGHEEEDADNRDRTDNGVGDGGGHGHAAKATVVAGRNTGRGFGGGDRKIAATAFAGAVESAATTTKPACAIIEATTAQTTRTAVHDNNDKTSLRRCGA